MKERKYVERGPRNKDNIGAGTKVEKGK